jgi:hypothetical protein
VAIPYVGHFNLPHSNSDVESCSWLLEYSGIRSGAQGCISEMFVGIGQTMPGQPDGQLQSR